MNSLGFDEAVLRTFAIAQTHEKDSKSLMYEFIALIRHPKYIFFAGSVQDRDAFFELRRRSCE
jgi:hypothetical protein